MLECAKYECAIFIRVLKHKHEACLRVFIVATALKCSTYTYTYAVAPNTRILRAHPPPYMIPYTYVNVECLLFCFVLVVVVARPVDYSGTYVYTYTAHLQHAAASAFDLLSTRNKHLLSVNRSPLFWRPSDLGDRPIADLTRRSRRLLLLLLLCGT